MAENASTTNHASFEWAALVALLSATDRAVDNLENNIPALYAACEIGSRGREQMWRTQPPSAAALAWKLRQAIYYEDLQDEDDHPLNHVLRDLEAMARAN